MQTNGAVQRPAIQIEKQDPTELMEAEVDGAAQESLAAPVVHVQLSHTASVVTTQCSWVTLKTTINTSLSLMCATFYTHTHTHSYCHAFLSHTMQDMTRALQSLCSSAATPPPPPPRLLRPSSFSLFSLAQQIISPLMTKLLQVLITSLLIAPGAFFLSSPAAIPSPALSQPVSVYDSACRFRPPFHLETEMICRCCRRLLADQKCIKQPQLDGNGAQRPACPRVRPRVSPCVCALSVGMCRGNSLRYKQK